MGRKVIAVAIKMMGSKKFRRFGTFLLRRNVLAHNYKSLIQSKTAYNLFFIDRTFRIVDCLVQPNVDNLNVHLDAVQEYYAHTEDRDPLDAVMALLDLSTVACNRLGLRQIGSILPKANRAFAWSFGESEMEYRGNESAIGILSSHALNGFILDLADVGGFSSIDSLDQAINGKVLLRSGNTIYLLLPDRLAFLIASIVASYTGKANLYRYSAFEVPNRLYSEFGTKRSALQNLCLHNPVRSNTPYINDSICSVDESRQIIIIFIHLEPDLVGEIVIDREFQEQISGIVKLRVDKIKTDFGHDCEHIVLLVFSGWCPSEQEITLGQYKYIFLMMRTFNYLVSSDRVTLADLWNYLLVTHRVKNKLSISENPKVISGIISIAVEQPERLHKLYEVSENTYSIKQNYFDAEIIKASLLTNIQHIANKDRHVVKSPLGERTVYQKHQESSNIQPLSTSNLYVSEDEFEHNGNLLLLVYGECRKYWIFGDATQLKKDPIYLKLIEAMAAWVVRLVQHYEEHIKIDSDCILWEMKFSNRAGNENENTVQSVAGLSNFLTTNNTLNGDVVSITTDISTEYYEGLLQEDNAAEKSLFLEFVTEVGDVNNAAALVDVVFNNSSAKHIHLFAVKEMLHRMEHLIGVPVLISNSIFLLSKIESGELINNAYRNRSIRGVAETTKFLQGECLALVDRTISALNRFNKKSILLMLYENINAINLQKTSWENFHLASTSIHYHKNLSKIYMEKMGRFNVALIAARIAIEVASCMRAGSGKKNVSSVDIGYILYLCRTVYEYGNYSDEIHYKLRRPGIFVTMRGDVLFDTVPERMSVTRKYQNELHRSILDGKDVEYSEIFSKQKYTRTEDAGFGDDFLKAWESEFGYSVDSARKIIDVFEDIALEKSLQVYVENKATLCGYLEDKNIDESHVNAFLDSFILPSRNNYKKPPVGYFNKDISPWRVGRRLSLLFRPITICEGKLVVSPILVGDAFNYVLRRYYESEIDSTILISDEMKLWCGSYSSTVGTDFNRQVAEELIRLGWQANSDVNVTTILKKSTAIDYGDVDVVAYNDVYNVVLLLECKYLDMCRTSGEVAKQLHEFRGEVYLNNKRDRLKKHIDRKDIIDSHDDELQKYLKQTYGAESTKAIRKIYGLVFSNTVPLIFQEKKELDGQLVTIYSQLAEISESLAKL